MHKSSPLIDSKLPRVGTTIFTVMSKLAADCGAINLSQGFPDFQADSSLFDATWRAMRAGRNQYPPLAGVPELRQAIADKVASLYNAVYDVESEITVTAGATQAVFTAIAAFVRQDDEVIVFEPVYDSYVPAIETVGGRAVYARLGYPGYRPDWQQVRALISPRTRMIIINSPHNPTGSLLGADDLEGLAELTRGTDIVILSDEVYEHIVYDGAQHQSVAGHPELAARSIVVSLWQDLSHHRLESRLRAWPRGIDGRVPEGPPVQRVHGQYAVPVGNCRVHGRHVAPSRTGSLLRREARVLPRPVGRFAV